MNSHNEASNLKGIIIHEYLAVTSISMFFLVQLIAKGISSGSGISFIFCLYLERTLYLSFFLFPPFSLSLSFFRFFFCIQNRSLEKVINVIWWLLWRHYISEKSNVGHTGSCCKYMNTMRQVIIKLLVFCICICFDGVVIPAQCTATFFKIYCAPANLGITRT